MNQILSENSKQYIQTTDCVLVEPKKTNLYTSVTLICVLIRVYYEKAT